MIEYKENAAQGIVEIAVDGKIEAEDFQSVIDRLQVLIERHGKLKLLEEIRSFGGMDPATFFKDLTWGLRHVNDFSHVAVVAEQGWVEAFTKGAAMFVPGEVKFFTADKIENARAWLAES
jgi:hypothetical protein